MREELEYILEHFEIKKQQLFYRKKVILNLEGGKKSIEKGKEILSNRLYSEFYCTGGNPDLLNSNHKLSEIALRRIEDLSKANQTQNRYDPYWTIEKIFDNKTALLKKENSRIRTSFNRFYLQDQSKYYPTEGDFVVFKHDKEFVADYFYHVMSQLPCSLEDKASVRFYFSVSYKGAPLLVKYLTGLLNRKQIPFMFKCIQPESPYAYRYDSAVLYVENKYANVCYHHIEKSFDQISNALRKSHPLFTIPLLPGLAFAESPTYKEGSFGSSRAKLIASLIFDCVLQGMQLEKWNSYIIKGINKQGYHSEQFYRNRNSVYPYSFLKE